MLSVQKITASKAKSMSRYYGAEAKALAKQLGISEKEADRELQQERAEVMSAKTGRDVSSILAEWRVEDKAESQAEAYDRTTGYYAVKQNERHRLINLRGGEHEVSSQDELYDMFVGRDAEGKSLKDPNKLRIEKLARMAELSVVEDLPAEYYDALRHGMNPETGEQLTGSAAKFQSEIYAFKEPKRPEQTVTAFDGTFSAPKSLSLLAATADEELREQIIDMHVEAINETLEHAEEHLVTVKRGAGNDAAYVSGKFIRAAVKVELSSRARDPQLHGHCTISTAVRGEDGRISSMDLRPWLGGSKYLGTTYRRLLTDKVTKELGVQWDRDPKTQLEEIRGVSRDEIEEHSKRSREIRDHLHAQAEEEAEIVAMVEKNPAQFQQARVRVQADAGNKRDQELADVLVRYDSIIRDREDGTTHVKRRQTAALHSRDHKAELTEDEQLMEWKNDERLVELGSRLNKMVERSREDVAKKDASWGLSKEELFDVFEAEYMANAATFKEKDLRQFIATHASSEYTLQEQANLADEYIAERAVEVRNSGQERVGGWAIAKNQPQTIYTTQEIVRRQERIVEYGHELNERKVRGYTPNWKHMQKLAEERNLTDEQEEILVQSSSGRGLSMTNGLAGSGKTYTLQTVTNTYRNANFTTIGLATRSQTAQELLEAGADRAYSLEKFLMDNPGGVLHDQQYIRGLPAEEMNLREDLEQAIREVKAQVNDGTLSQASGERETQKLQNELDAWTQRRQDEKVEWQEYTHLSGIFESLSREKQQEAYSRMAEIRETNPYAKISFEEDTRRRHYLIDEAGMASDVHLEKLLGYIAKHDREAVITMVGDIKQLESVQVGTAFDLLTARLGATEMSKAYRPNHEWEAQTQQEWHKLPSLGDSDARKDLTVHKARRLVETYKQHGRVQVIGRDAVNDAIAEAKLSPNEVMPGASKLAQEEAAERYFQIRDSGASGCVLAHGHIEVAEINDRVQTELKERGEVDQSKSVEVLVSEEKGIKQTAHIGDTVAIRANQNKSSLLNGQLGTVERITPSGVYISVPDEYDVKHMRFIDRETLATKEVASLGYAQTIASSQGITVDEAVLLVDPMNAHTARENIYVGMSRGKESNSIILMSNDGSSDETVEQALAEAMVTRGREMSPLDVMEQAMGREAVEKQQAEFAADGIPVTDEEAKSMLEPQAAEAAEKAVEKKRVELKRSQHDGKVELTQEQAARREALAATQQRGRARTRERAMAL